MPKFTLFGRYQRILHMGSIYIGREYRDRLYVIFCFSDVLNPTIRNPRTSFKSSKYSTNFVQTAFSRYHVFDKWDIPSDLNSTNSLTSKYFKDSNIRVFYELFIHEWTLYTGYIHRHRVYTPGIYTTVLSSLDCFRKQPSLWEIKIFVIRERVLTKTNQTKPTTPLGSRKLVSLL